MNYLDDENENYISVFLYVKIELSQDSWVGYSF